jgi:hypothetical protein
MRLSPLLLPISRPLDLSSSPLAAAASEDRGGAPPCKRLVGLFLQKNEPNAPCDVTVRIPKQPQRNNVRQPTQFFSIQRFTHDPHVLSLVERVATRRTRLLSSLYSSSVCLRKWSTLPLTLTDRTQSTSTTAVRGRFVAVRRRNRRLLRDVNRMGLVKSRTSTSTAASWSVTGAWWCPIRAGAGPGRCRRAHPPIPLLRAIQCPLTRRGSAPRRAPCYPRRAPGATSSRPS